jgi:hypothetical protein
VTPGQAGDSPQFRAVLAGIKVRGRVGRPRTRPDAVAADKAYSSRANRAYLRRRRIRAVIPEKADQAANRKKRGSRGGRPVSHDPELYKERNTAEPSSTGSRSGVAWPPASTRPRRAISPASTYEVSSCGSEASGPPEWDKGRCTPWPPPMPAKATTTRTTTFTDTVIAAGREWDPESDSIIAIYCVRQVG